MPSIRSTVRRRGVSLRGRGGGPAAEPERVKVQRLLAELEAQKEQCQAQNERLVELAEKYLKKGSKIYVEGQLQTRKWQDQQGQDRYTTEIVLSRFRGELTMLDPARGSGGAEAGYDEGDPGSYGTRAAAAPVAAGRGRGTAADLDDEIPF